VRLLPSVVAGEKIKNTATTREKGMGDLSTASKSKTRERKLKRPENVSRQKVSLVFGGRGKNERG